MIDDAVPLMQRYLASPSRQPDYRADRNHHDFCTNLGAYEVDLEPLRADLAIACQQLIQSS